MQNAFFSSSIREMPLRTCAPTIVIEVYIVSVVTETDHERFLFASTVRNALFAVTQILNAVRVADSVE
jgi:hypothetical protein